MKGTGDSSEPAPAVRLARLADAPAIGRLLHDFNTEFDEPTLGPVWLAERIEQLLAGGDFTVLLGEPGAHRPGARRPGAPGPGAHGPGAPGAGAQGLAVLRFRPSIWTAALECYLAELYVIPEQRGRGFGRALMQAALDIARSLGADYMDLGTSEDDAVARALYESLGFNNREGKPDGPINFFYERRL